MKSFAFFSLEVFKIKGGGKLKVVFKRDNLTALYRITWKGQKGTSWESLEINLL